jgi:hypothetical protein
MDQAVYIGAGCDIIPVLVFRDIKKFIYIDSKPFSEHGISVYTKDYVSLDTTIETREIYEENNLFGRSNFISDFEQIMNQNNFILELKTKYCLIYKNKYDQIIKYHISCSFPEFLTEEIINDIKECNTLILCGHIPNKKILSMMKYPKTIIGNCHTVYSYIESDNEHDRVSEYLLKYPYIMEKYILMKEINPYEHWEHKNIIESIRDNYKIIYCNNLIDLENNR